MRTDHDECTLRDANVNIPKLAMGRLSDVHTPQRRPSKDDPTPKSGRHMSKDFSDAVNRTPDLMMRQKLGTPRLAAAVASANAPPHTPRQQLPNTPLTPAYANPKLAAPPTPSNPTPTPTSAGPAHSPLSSPRGISMGGSVTDPSTRGSNSASTSRNTATSQNLSSPLSARRPSATSPDEAEPVIPKPDPEQEEKVYKYHYDVKTDTWTKSEAKVYIHPIPFQSGTMRTAFHLFDLSKPEGQQHFVCKMSKDPEDQKDTSTYFDDVEMQAFAKLFADEFNKMNPPKRVDFVEASLIKCLDRQQSPILAVEPYLKGKYVKHSNNYGFVSEEDRNTPQAFSHFTYCKSRGEYLICDIQGVQDKYTDPQIHSKDGKGFGKGNMGIEGMVKFFQSHRCNAVCKYLNLPAHQTKQNDVGTLVSALPQGRYTNEFQPAQLAPLERKPRPMQNGAPMMCNMKPATPRIDRSSTSAVPPGLNITPEQHSNCQRLFAQCDKESKGYLERDEFILMCALVSKPLTNKEVEEALASVGPSGRMDYRAFLIWFATVGKRC